MSVYAARTVSRRPTVALLNPGDPRDQAVWSGVPYGVLSGLQAAGADVIAVSVNPDRSPFIRDALGVMRHVPRARRFEGRSRLRVAHSTAQIDAATARRRAIAGAEALRTLAPDGAVAINFSPHAAPAGVRLATLEDMTIRQALAAFSYGHWNTLTDRQIQRRLDAQQAGYHAADVCCATNSWAAGSIHTDYGVPTDAIHVVGMGSNVPVMSVSRSFAVPRFLFVGREWERKNGPAILRGFAAVRRAYVDAELHLVGGHPPVQQDGVVGHGALRLGNTDEREQLRELFAQATCFVMPSLLEPSAVAFAEAAAAGIGSIGTIRGGSMDLIGDAGFVVDPSDDDEIAATMLACADPAVATDLAARAVARAPVLSWKAVGERLLEALELGPPAAPLRDRGRSPLRVNEISERA